MSTTNAPGFCETTDVQEALQEASANFGVDELSTANVEAAIVTASDWFARTINTHFYDSNAASGDLISTTSATASEILLSVPAGPHAQRGQLFNDENVLYPRTFGGNYTRVKIPFRHVESIDTLNVRDAAGDWTDWTTEKTQGYGEDFYLQDVGQDSYGRSYLYLHAGELGAHNHFEDVLRVDISYGLDWDDEPWDDVRRGIAQLAAAELVVNDDVLASVPDDGQLINVQTEAEQYVTKALDQPGYLKAHLVSHPVA